MRGEIPVWLFVLCLSVAVLAAFVAGYFWTHLVRRWRVLRQVRAALARLDAEADRLRSPDPVDTTRFTG